MDFLSRAGVTTDREPNRGLRSGAHGVPVQPGRDAASSSDPRESPDAPLLCVLPPQDLKPVIDGMDGIKISQGLGLQDFDLIRVIGRGSYAKVLLVRLKKNDQVYAMKVVKKELVHDDEVSLTARTGAAPSATQGRARRGRVARSPVRSCPPPLPSWGRRFRTLPVHGATPTRGQPQPAFLVTRGHSGRAQAGCSPCCTSPPAALLPSRRSAPPGVEGQGLGRVCVPPTPGDAARVAGRFLASGALAFSFAPGCARVPWQQGTHGCQRAVVLLLSGHHRRAPTALAGLLAWGAQMAPNLTCDVSQAGRRPLGPECQAPRGGWRPRRVPGETEAPGGVVCQRPRC